MSDEETSSVIGGDRLRAPFPYFGGKSWIANVVWDLLGDPENYVEPFCGSAAVLLARPIHRGRRETVNDADGMIANFWRSVSMHPEETAEHATHPVNEADLTARHIWLVNRRESLTERLMADPEWCDTKIAGWWCWGISCWIGSGFCSGNGPWNTDGRQLVHLGNDGQGVNRKLVHLGDDGQGVNRQLVHLGNDGQGVKEWFARLQSRLFRVRVCCGDWSRVVTPTVVRTIGTTGVFLDPPYSNELRAGGLYTHDDGSVAAQCAEWALENGHNKHMRIVVAGYKTEHSERFRKSGWREIAWTGHKGMSSGDNRFSETLWASPHCESQRQTSLF